MVIVKKRTPFQKIVDIDHFMRSFVLEKIDRAELYELFHKITGMSYPTWKKTFTNLATKIIVECEILEKLVASLKYTYLIDYDIEDDSWVIWRTNIVDREKENVTIPIDFTIGII